MSLKNFSLIIFRFWLVVLPILLVSCSESDKKGEPTNEGIKELQVTNSPFIHGVASGDPTQNSVIIWTRVEPNGREMVEGKWKICVDEKMENLVLEGTYTTTADRDYTVKIYNGGLEAGKYYYYQFEAFGKKSIIGRTKTLPENTEKIKLGFASCSNYKSGYFNAYRVMGDDSLDVVIHLGDYIYEYANGTKDVPLKGRNVIPDKELIYLEDYRTRYSQYRQDEDLKYLHSRHPFIVIYDDHELANNAYEDGAQNHDATEGDWQERVVAAKKAYYEWMPIAENEGKHYRSFSFGKLANLIMVDTRTDGRTVQPDKVDVNDIDTSAHIMSKEQMDWLIKELFKDHQWKIIGNQILFSDISVFFGKSPQFYNDGWSAYRKDHELLEKNLQKVRGTIFVTGDFHSSFGITRYVNDANYDWLEFVVPSITSTNYDEDNGADSALIYKRRYDSKNDDMIFYSNLIDHGYFKLELTEFDCKGWFVFTKTILEKSNDSDKKGFHFRKPILQNKILMIHHITE